MCGEGGGGGEDVGEGLVTVMVLVMVYTRSHNRARRFSSPLKRYQRKRSPLPSALMEYTAESIWRTQNLSV